MPPGCMFSISEISRVFVANEKLHRERESFFSSLRWGSGYGVAGGL